MDDVEADVRAPLAGVGVVLQQGVEKHLGVEEVIDATGHQRGRERALAQGRPRLSH